MNDLFDNNYEILKIFKRAYAENGIFYDEIQPDENLNLDSLTLVSLLVCLENELNIEFPDEYLINIPQTFNGMFQLVLNIITHSNGDEENAILLLEGGTVDEEKTQKA